MSGASYSWCDFGGPRLSFPHNPEDDHRPRCVLVLGNGFTINYLRQCGLPEGDPIRLGSLIPQPASVHYIPGERDIFERGPLWDEAKFPRLWNAYHDLRAGLETDRDAFMTLCRQLSVDPGLHSDPDKRWLSIGSANHVSNELRAYLWHVFAQQANHQLADRRLSAQTTWDTFLGDLLSRYRVTCITFNYDVLLDLVVHKITKKHALSHPCCNVPLWLSRSQDDLVIFRPHGSIGHGTILDVQQNWWLSDPPEFTSFFENRGHAYVLGDAPSTCSFFPDLVPPGHDLGALANPNADARQACNLAMRDADCLVVCGFSADNPDSSEFDKYLSHVREGTPVAHCDIDSQVQAASILRNRSLNYSFKDAGAREELEIVEWLGTTTSWEARPLSIREAFVLMTAGHYTEEQVDRLLKEGYR